MDWYRDLVDTGRAQAAWLLLAFFITFAVTRAITRRIRAKQARQAQASSQPVDGGGLSNVYIGGVHIHHQVWGILMVLLAGLLQFRYAPHTTPWAEVLAVIFGAGAALTLDEFALWLYLDDVYWGPEGRKSVDAIVLGGALGAVLLVQTSPIGAGPGAGDAPARWTYFGAVGFHLVMAVLCFLKGKFATGVIGIVVPFVALVGAVRLAKPSSPWALRRYDEPKRERARSRFGATYDKRWNRVLDMLGGRFSSR